MGKGLFVVRDEEVSPQPEQPQPQEPVPELRHERHSRHPVKNAAKVMVRMTRKCCMVYAPSVPGS